MKINVSQVLKQVAEDKLKPKPLPKIKVKKAESTPEPDPEFKISITVDDQAARATLGHSRLIADLWNEYHKVGIEQKKLSTQIAHLVREGASTERMKEQYDKIESYQPQLQVLRDQISYAEKHGALPPDPEPEKEIDDINVLMLKKTSLAQKRCKLKAKLAKKVAKNPERFVQWEQDLAAADMEWQYVERRISELK
jgi:predicted  nucleic acid-binding Zn-ribbon protein